MLWSIIGGNGNEEDDLTASVRFFAVLFLIPLPGLLILSCGEPESEQAVLALVATDVTTYWAVIGQDTEQNHYIRPVVRFRVVNRWDKDVGYIQAMAVFRRESFPDESWGSDFIYSISEKALVPGGQSDLLTLRSDSKYISKDAPEQMFQNEEWEQIIVEIFVRVGSSTWIPLFKEEILQRIGAPGLEKFLDPDSSTVLAGDEVRG